MRKRFYDLIIKIPNSERFGRREFVMMKKWRILFAYVRKMNDTNKVLQTKYLKQGTYLEQRKFLCCYVVVNYPSPKGSGFPQPN